MKRIRRVVGKVLSGCRCTTLTLVFVFCFSACANQNIESLLAGCWQAQYQSYSVRGTESLIAPQLFMENLEVDLNHVFTQTVNSVDDKTFSGLYTGTWMIASQQSNYAEINFKGMKYFGAGVNPSEAFDIYMPVDIPQAMGKIQDKFTYPNDGLVIAYFVKGASNTIRGRIKSKNLANLGV